MSNLNLKTLVLGASLLAAAGLSQATESGLTTAARGAEGFLAGALPPPGLYGLVYVNHYNADRFNDGDGESLIPGFKVKATALVGRLLYMSDLNLLGGQAGIYGVLPLVDLKVEMAGTTSTHTGLGDAEIGPLIAWHHSPQWHSAAALAFVTPNGDYDKNRVANTGNNLFSWRPVFVASYLGDSVDASAKFTYTISHKNGDTDYQSGQYLHADYNLGLRVSPSWQVGLQGYLVHQTTDDKLNGAKVGDGFRTKVFAVGPAVRWQPTPTSPWVELRLQREISARYHSQGTALWLKAVWAL